MSYVMSELQVGVTVPFLVGKSVEHVGLEQFLLQFELRSESQQAGMSFSALSPTGFETVTSCGGSIRSIAV